MAVLFVLLALAVAAGVLWDRLDARRDRCPTCSGRGYKVKRVNNMQYSHGGGMAGYAHNRTRNNNWREVRTKCTRCSGSGII